MEVIQEFAHVRARRRTRADAAALALEYVELLAPLAEVGDAAVRRGLRTYAATDRIGPFDAVLAAVAETRAITSLVSADRALAAIPGLDVTFPDAAGIDRLLGA